MARRRHAVPVAPHLYKRVDKCSTPGAYPRQLCPCGTWWHTPCEKPNAAGQHPARRFPSRADVGPNAGLAALCLEPGARVNPAALDIRTIKATIGALALVAAVAVGVGAMLAASLFGALAALALGAGAGLAAALELLESDPRHVWRLAASVALVPGWIVLAVLLLNTPLRDLDALRLLSSLLFVGGATVRVARWRAHREGVAPGLGVALGFTLLALAATWSGLSLHTGDMPCTALSIGWALELCAAGSFWLGEALIARDGQSASNEEARRPVAAALHMT